MPGGRPRNKPDMKCPNPDHHGSHVVGNGQLVTNDGTRQVWRCTPKGGKARHTFSTLDGEDAMVVPQHVPSPPCPVHGRKCRVSRDGTYGRSGSKRQRYRSVPHDEAERAKYLGGKHTFTPRLAREHVHYGESHCEGCGEALNVHRGSGAAARRQTWNERIVAEGLVRLAKGDSYGAVSEWAWDETGRKRTRPVRLSPAEQQRRAKEADWLKAVREAESCGLPAPRRPRGTATVLPGDPPERRRPLDATGKPAAARKRSTRTRTVNTRWHTAADWVEVYGPVVWQPLEKQLLRAERAEARRRGALNAQQRLADGRPSILLLDDIPVNTRATNDGTGKRVSRRAYFVLGAASIVWPQAAGTTPATADDRFTKLRLMRAYPTNEADAWKLLFHELGYRPGVHEPEFILSDAGTGLLKAVGEFFTTAVVVPSLYHLTQAVASALEGTPGATVMGDEGQMLRPELLSILAALSADRLRTMDEKRWAAWWDSLERVLDRYDLSQTKLGERRTNYEKVVGAALPKLRNNPAVPLSTGGFETVLRTSVQTVLTGRRAGFANIERTNSLLDLVVAYNRGAMSNTNQVIKLIRSHSERSGGWAAPVRDVADPQPPFPARYSSLRDKDLVTDLAETKGLR